MSQTGQDDLQQKENAISIPSELLDSEIGFRMDWKNRRKVIFYCLIGIGGLFTITLFCLIGQMFFGGKDNVDVNVVNAIQSAMFLLLTSFISIAGGYLFGVQFDLNSLRSNMVNLVSAVTKK
jgi:hypothetical protein